MLVLRTSKDSTVIAGDSLMVVFGGEGPNVDDLSALPLAGAFVVPCCRHGPHPYAILFAIA